MSMIKTATAVKERANASVEALTAALTEVREIATSASALTEEDPIPTEFIGVIHEYRYGKSNGDDMPLHFFEVECDSGLWLHSRCPSRQFDAFIKDTDIAMLDSATMLNGKVTSVRRVPGMGIIPIKLIGEKLDEGDVNGNFLYVGCRATYIPNGIECKILSGDSGSLKIRFTDDTESVQVPGNLRKII